ncbi:hypothetical protein [Streptomyces sp. NPDC006997]|uniref:hypothetical protein n=1 Tax=Streptomyces sp. NPDC006997 TaxID=3155356 RepID=UPI0033C14953
MRHGPSRRATLLAAASCALVVPVLRPGTAHAADTATAPAPPREPSPATHSRHPAAQYAPDAARRAHAEPLNATVDCALGQGARD